MDTHRFNYVNRTALRMFLVFSTLFTIHSISAEAEAPLCRPKESPVPPTYMAQSCDWILRDFLFADASHLPQLRLHYMTVGKPHRDSKGSIDNAVLLLHWTGS